MNDQKLMLSCFLLFIISVTPAVGTAQKPEPVIDCATAYPTRDKPQSKLWYAKDCWWAWLPFGDQGGRLWRRGPGGAWSPQTRLDSSLKALPGRADIWASGRGDTVAAALVEDKLLAVACLLWNPGIESYELSGAPIRWRALSEVETITIDRQGDGAFWTAYPEDVPEGRRIVARKIDPPAAQSGLGEPVILAEGLYEDEICAVCVLGDGSVGVMWSDQHAEMLFFRTHSPKADPASWSAADTVAAGDKTADDHLNFCRPPASSGPVLLAATKTSLDSVGLPLLSLRVLETGGRWHSVPFALLSPDSHPSRPIVIWSSGRPVCLYTVYGPGKSFERLNSITLQAFFGEGLKTSGPHRVVIPAVKGLNDLTGPKQAPSGASCLILASDREGKVYEAFIGR